MSNQNNRNWGRVEKLKKYRKAAGEKITCELKVEIRAEILEIPEGRFSFMNCRWILILILIRIQLFAPVELKSRGFHDFICFGKLEGKIYGT